MMQEAKLNVARMGEFAWSTFEPSKGVFNFYWMDRAITLLAVNGIQTVMGTPTAAPPAWLIQEHPDILTVDDDGRRTQFGNRCHYCGNSPEFHAATTRLAAMARWKSKHYRWQIDNEFSWCVTASLQGTVSTISCREIYIPG
jgi:beta-galactosidase